MSDHTPAKREESLKSTTPIIIKMREKNPVNRKATQYPVLIHCSLAIIFISSVRERAVIGELIFTFLAASSNLGYCGLSACAALAFIS